MTSQTLDTICSPRIIVHPPLCLLLNSILANLRFSPQRIPQLSRLACYTQGHPLPSREAHSAQHCVCKDALGLERLLSFMAPGAIFSLL